MEAEAGQSQRWLRLANRKEARKKRAWLKTRNAYLFTYTYTNEGKEDEDGEPSQRPRH